MNFADSVSVVVSGILLYAVTDRFSCSFRSVIPAVGMTTLRQTAKARFYSFEVQLKAEFGRIPVPQYLKQSVGLKRAVSLFYLRVLGADLPDWDAESLFRPRFQTVRRLPLPRRLEALAVSWPNQCS